MYEEVSGAFQYGSVAAQKEQWEYDHGHYETRRCKVMTASGYLSPKFTSRWHTVGQFVCLTAERTIGEVNSMQTMYYLCSSTTFDAARMNEFIRRHWSIENQLHWHLDGTFGEDASRARSSNAALNTSILCKMALH